MYKFIGKNGIRLLLFLAGMVCLTAGILQGDYRDTLIKAIMICLECIGIG
ncbi:MAG: CD1871A family CXXC motif-containing protein [Lachnospiraceae bacterium]|nr:CD1871A family CXXC motif-containing protein [Lachnospiraceae bacterium]MDY4969673.1 CD1871A family CXXC motif-containing protein [Lachnospiraceae bacterium]